MKYMECFDVGLPICTACKINAGVCWIEWYRRKISEQGFLKALKHTGSFPDEPMYFAMVIKLYYPQYEKLLVLL